MITFIDLFAGIGGFRYGLEKSGIPGCKTQTQMAEWSGMEVGRNLHLRRSEHPGYRCVWSNEWDRFANSVYRRHYGECDSRDVRTVNADEVPDHELLCAGFPCQAFSIAGKRKGFRHTQGTLFFEIARIIQKKRPRLLLLENVKGLLNHSQGKTFAVILTTLDELGYDCQWQVLNSKDFFLPQNRERVFIIGNLRGTSRPQVFPLGTDSQEIVELWYQNSQEGRHSGNIESQNRRSAERPKILIRQFTPLETERLQGFPDNWTKYGYDGETISDTQRYKMTGNAVSTPIIKVIGEKL